MSIAIQKICFEWLKQDLAGKRKSQGIASLKMHEKHTKISIFVTETCFNWFQ